MEGTLTEELMVEQTTESKPAKLSVTTSIDNGGAVIGIATIIVTYYIVRRGIDRRIARKIKEHLKEQ